MISLGTVYKTLERFYEVGLVQKVSPLTEVARYDAIVSPHHHLVCLKCQDIQDMMGSPLTQEIALPDGNGFHVLRHQVLVQGYCPNCHQKSEPAGR
jgi:Fur family transcriptional regulator, peroxide stress response regulator